MESPRSSKNKKRIKIDIKALAEKAGVDLEDIDEIDIVLGEDVEISISNKNMKEKIKRTAMEFLFHSTVLFVVHLAFGVLESWGGK